MGAEPDGSALFGVVTSGVGAPKLCVVSTAALTLVTKPGCHLCDAARDVVTDVVAQLVGVASAPTITVAELSILDDPVLLEKYAEEIPVLLLNGSVHNIWRIDPARLRAALLEV